MTCKVESNCAEPVDDENQRTLLTRNHKNSISGQPFERSERSSVKMSDKRVSNSRCPVVLQSQGKGK